MDNYKISNHLEEITKLLELTEANAFKVRAYENGTRIIRSLKEEAIVLLENKKLINVKGIGKSLLQDIEEFVKNGTSQTFETLKNEIPNGVLELMQIKGLGIKKVKVIVNELKITTLGELEYACLENRLVTLDGFGEKTQENILKNIAFLKRSKGFKLLNTAFEEAELLQDFFIQNLKPARFELCGKLVQGIEVIDELNFLTDCKINELQNLVIEKGSSEIFSKIRLEDNKIIGTSATGLNFTLETNSKNFGARLLELNSTENFVKEIHLASDNKNFETENEVFESKKLSFIFPEVRHFGVELGTKFSQNLVCEKDIQGIFHNHTTYSDGKATLEEMVLEAKNSGYTYIGISDHSKTAFYANGLTEERIEEQHKEIDDLNSKLDGIKIFKGIESDILSDGSLDYNNEILSKFDFVIASVHSKFGLSEEEMTARIIKAVENPFTTMLGHLTGRLLLSRAEYPLNVPKIIDACAQNSVCIELNANPHRLDLDWRFMQNAFEKGVKISINPDAHSLEGLKDVKFGIKIARRGGTQKENVLNTLNFETVLNCFVK
ncbi:PHP domain-containing protein [bacterium]|nr:PHP domain-containing protein [bacterium]